MDLAYLLERRGVVELHTSSFIPGEVERVLREKFGWEEGRASCGSLGLLSRRAGPER